MIKIAHESPVPYFDQVQQQTDYDYALVHLFEENEEYYSKFKFAVQKGREVLLDNSIFELGEAFDKDKYAVWIEKLQPSWYIIPDVLEGAEETVKNVKEWQHLAGFNTIGVVQGKAYDEICWCYQEIAPLVDKIAISFDYSFFNDLVMDMAYDDVSRGWLPTKYHIWAKGRQILLDMMIEDNIIIHSKPHHLLGCGLPQEFKHYTRYGFIDSLDTSNPVVAGYKGIRYNGLAGLEDKPSVKLFTLIDEVFTEKQKRDVDYNIRMFRMMTNHV